MAYPTDSTSILLLDEVDFEKMPDQVDFKAGQAALPCLYLLRDELDFEAGTWLEERRGPFFAIITGRESGSPLS